MQATPVATEAVSITALTSTPVRFAFSAAPNESAPTRPIIRTAIPSRASFAAANAWLPPLPPGTVRKSRPRIVSPGIGSRSTEMTKSMFKLPTTTMEAGIGFSEARGADQDQSNHIPEKHQPDQVPRPPRRAHEFTPYHYAPDGRHQRCALSQRV